MVSAAASRAATTAGSHPASTSSGGFPVLSAGPTPHTPLDQWTFTIDGMVDEPLRWTWEELQALPAEPITTATSTA